MFYFPLFLNYFLPLLEGLEFDLHCGQMSLNLQLVLLDDFHVLLLGRPALLVLQREVVRVLNVLNVFRKNALNVTQHESTNNFVKTENINPLERKYPFTHQISV